MRVRCEGREGAVWRLGLEPDADGQVALDVPGLAQLQALLVEASAEGALPALPVPPPLPSVAATAAAESRKHGHHGRAASVTEKLK